MCNYFFKHIWVNFEAVLLGHCKRCHCQRCCSDEDGLSRSHKRSWQAPKQTLPGIPYPWHRCLVFSWFSSTGLSAQTWRRNCFHPSKGRKNICLISLLPLTGLAVSPSLLLYYRNSLTWELILLINQVHLYTTGPNLNIQGGTRGYSLCIRGSGVPPPLGQIKITQVWDAAPPQRKLSLPSCILRSQHFRNNPGLPSLYLE